MTFSWNDLFAMAPHTLVIAGGLIILVAQMLLKAQRARIAWQLCVLTLSAAAIVVIFGLSDATGQLTVLPRAFLGTEAVLAISGSIRYTSFSANAILLFLAIALCVIFFMRKIVPALDLDFAENYFLLLMSVAGYSYAICAEDFITLFVALELGSLPILVLIGLNRKDTATNEAALKYLLLSAFAIAFLLMGIALLYSVGGSVRLRDIKELGPHFMRTRVMILAYVLIFAGFLFKLGAFPLHSYIADVYEGSATIFTGLLASLSKAGALLVLVKINFGMHDGYRTYFAPILTVVAAGSMLYGAFASLGAKNLKRLIAYSSIGHAGFMLCFFVIPSGTEPGIIPALKQEAGAAVYIYAVGYVFSSLLAFGAIAYAERMPGAPASIDLDNLSELFSRNKLAGWALGIAVLSFMGMPPLAGFIGKFFLFRYLALSNNLILAAIAGLATAISVFAYVKILKALFFSDSPSGTESALFGDAGKVATGFLLAVVGFFAIFTSFLYNYGVTAMQKIF